MCQGLIVAPDDVDSQYQYTYCETTRYDARENTTICTGEALRTVYVSPLQPPFLYNSQCTSTILTSYIPVYIFVYVIQVCVTISLVAISNSVEYKHLPEWVVGRVQGVLWSEHEWVCSRSCPGEVMKATKIICFDILNHLAVLATFGISSPYLVLILYLAVTLKLYMWRVKIGQFVYQRTATKCSPGGGDIKRIDDDGVSVLQLDCLQIMVMIEENLRPIIVCSAAFYFFICWDMTSDDLGWRASFWAPVSIFVLTILLLFILRSRFFGLKYFDVIVNAEDIKETKSPIATKRLLSTDSNPVLILAGEPSGDEIEMRNSEF